MDSRPAAGRMGDVLCADEVSQSVTDTILAGETRAAPDAKAEVISQTAASKLSDANCRMRAQV